ncbi:uncharacterized protein LOC133721005 [Rosa rugosa]|uniref:uncharacterized protein LOC133721005 n=1 Tax=Rosa rugosa TaxID=74645 RepID=UPI002B402075|nr:uncharacterized protein LOC133721005 [Rosa rugosa]
MECNKDEAERAMQLSEKKIQNKDFKGAKEMALKAQRLYPQLDNISRLITVCEVHCSAEKKVGGSEMDWYGILQIQQFDDEATIKKQYRKLGLLLHPDKNRFTGAEAAFKLIGEANRVLTDQGSRSKYDIKLSALTGTKSLGHQSYFNFFGPKHSSAASSVLNIPQSRYTSVNLHQPVNVQQPVQPDTIKIACPSCKRMYDYNFANRLIFCQRCLGIFDASDLGPESLGNPVAPSQGSSKEASQRNGGTGYPSSTTNGNATSKAASATEGGGASKTVKRDIENGVGIEKQGVERSESGPLKSKNSRKSRNGKRGENATFDSGESSKTGKEKVGIPSEVSEHHTRRSSRSMHNHSFYESVNDDDDDENDDDVGDVKVNDDVNVSPSKVRESPFPTATRKKRVNAFAYGGVYRQTVLALCAMDEYRKLGKQRVRRKRSNTDEIELQVNELSMADSNGSKSVADNSGSKSVADNSGSKSVADNSGSKSVADNSGSKSVANNSGSKSMTSMRKIIEVPEPEFHRFVVSKDVLQKTFKANQTWVLYDPADGMPRRYACIKKVLHPGFRVKITWLEPDPDDQGEVDWCSKKLPVACGKFGLALTEEVTDHTVFSHEYIHSTKGRDKSSFRIYPRKGETWALYQDWDLGWSSEPEKHSQYKFDFVEVLSDFSEKFGTGVAYLGKVKGFVSLFEPAEQQGVLKFQVPPNDLYRFSHQIPSYKMSGSEGYGVPAGSFEFDPASLPASLFNRRSTVTIAKPSGFVPSGRARPAKKEVKKNDEPILIDYTVNNGSYIWIWSPGLRARVIRKLKPVMERNKGEAVRAMQLSEMKIQENDFAGAREMARIAHRLFPEDENISKLLALSEVYYSIFESGESSETGDTARADFEQFIEKVSSPSGNLNDDDDDDDSDDGDDDSDDDYDYDDDDDDEDDDYDYDYDGNNEYDDHDGDDDGDDDFVIAPKRLRERQLKSYTEKEEKNAVDGGVSTSVVSRPKRLRHSQFLSVINRMHDTFKDHNSISSIKSSSTPPSSSAAQFYDFNAQKSEEKIRVGQIWALYSDGNGMSKTFAQVKRINVRPNKRVQRTVSSGHFYLRMGLLEPFLEPKNMVEPVCCGTFKVKRAPPTLFSLTSLSHRVKARLLGQNIFEIIPRRGEVWALYKEHNPLVTYPNTGKGECLVVEVLEVQHQSTKIVVLEQLNGFKSVFKAPTVQSTKTGVIDIPQAELGRFSHQISAFKHTKVSHSRLAGCWELDPLSVSGYEKDGVPKCFFNCDPASLLNNPDYSCDLGDLKMDKRSMNTETHGLSGELLEGAAKSVIGSASIETGTKQETPFAERETSEKVESRVCHFFFGKDLVDSVKLEASHVLML